MTDSHHYARLSAHGALRFIPNAYSRARDVRRVHGTDERMRMSHLRAALCTTRRALQLFGEHAGGTPGPGAGGTDSSSPAGGKLRREAPASVV